MDIKPAEITDILRREIKEYDREIDVAETGTVLSIGDGIARVYGLDNAMAGELVEFPGGISGMVLNLEEDNVGIAVMGEAYHVREGDVVLTVDGREVFDDRGMKFIAATKAEGETVNLSILLLKKAMLLL